MSGINTLLSSHRIAPQLSEDAGDFTFSSLLIGSARIFRQLYRHFIPLYLLLVVFFALFLFAFSNKTSTQTAFHYDFISFFVSWMHLLLFYLFLSFVTQLYIGIVQQPKGAWLHAFSGYFKNFFNILLASVIVSISIVIGSILVLPGIYFMIAFLLYIPSLIVQDLSAIKSIQSSYKLMAGHWWLGLLTVGTPLVIYALFVGVTSKLPFLNFNNDIFLALIYPAIFVFFITIYLNLYLNLYKLKFETE